MVWGSGGTMEPNALRRSTESSQIDGQDSATAIRIAAGRDFPPIPPIWRRYAVRKLGGDGVVTTRYDHIKGVVMKAFTHPYSTFGGGDEGKLTRELQRRGRRNHPPVG